MQPSNASQNEYNYQTGSGMDGFVSRALDEVSWQNTLGAYYNTLATYPIGTSPTTATATNYDQTQVSGAQSGTSILGGSSGSGSSAGVTSQANNNSFVVNDGVNDRVIIGYNQATQTWGVFASPPGVSIDSTTNVSQLALSSDFPQLLVPFSGSYTFPIISGSTNQGQYQSFQVQHGLNFPPAYLVYLQIQGPDPNNPPGNPSGLPSQYYIEASSGISVDDQSLTLYQYGFGVDNTNFYAYRTVNNTAGAYAALAGTITYYILQKTA